MALAHEAIRLSVANQGLPGLIGAPTYPMLRDATQRAFFEILEANEIPYDHHKSENIVTLTHLGSDIFFRSLDNYERLRGTNLAWFGLDELTYTDEEAWLRLLARLRHPLAKELCGFAAWTPRGFDWVYRKFIGPDKLQGYEAILASPRENTYLPGDYYDSLARSYDPRFFQQEAEGLYLSVSGNRVYYAFERAESMKALDIESGKQLCWALDFNVNPMCSVIAQIDDRATRSDVMAGIKRIRLNVLDEIVLPNANITEACNEFIRRTEKYAARHGQIHVNVYGDASANARTHAGPSSWELVMGYFRNDARYRLNRNVRQSNPPVKDRVNAVNAALLNATGERRMFIDPRCKELVADFEQVAWKEDASGNQTADLDKSDTKRTHISDALGYLVEREMPIKSTNSPFRRESIV